MRHSLPYRMLRKRPMKLSTTVILMVSAVLFSVLLVVHLIYFSQISDMTRDGLANKALAVARTLADSPEIRQGLQKKPQESGIQAIAEAVRKRNDLLFIVVTDMQSLRYSHPEAQRIGQPFKGDDILKALNGEENVAINRGFLAQALRVFTPIYDENHKQIGVVAIGLELSRVTQQINDSRWSIIWSVLFSVLLVVHLIYFSQISDMTRDGLANKALAVARTLADSPEIRQGLQKKPQESGIQAIAEAVRKRNDLLFIVVTDMQSLRYSHPEAQRIGQPFKGDDILKALNGEENVAINRGFLAQALRVFTPIYDENHKQIGVVAIGLELSRVTQQINDSRWSIIWSVLFGMLVGLIGTCILVNVLKKILFGLEPYEISTLFEQRQAMLQSIKEGVVAVDDRGEVTLINDAAQELLNYRKSQDDEKLSTLSHSWSQVVDVSEVLRDGTPRRDEEITIKDRLLLINTVPVRSNGVIIGAISTFRDKTEVRKLMQRLDGLVNYADALRERSHEFMNKLHVILGLLHLKSYKQLEDYILKTANNYQEEIGSLLGKIKSPVIAGFLFILINRATDLGHTLILNSESQLPDSGSEDQVATLITTLGNLIENALEALGPEPGGEISVTLHYRHGWLHCEVNDDGPGIAPDKIDHIFDKGVSTKGSERGVGLALVKQQVENLGGSIAVESEPGIFTQFFVQIPWDGERSNR